MVKSLMIADTQIIDKKHSGKFISNLTYDVNHITNLLSNAILTLFKDGLTLIGFINCNVLSKLETITYFNNYDSFSKYYQQKLLEKEWVKLQQKLKKNQDI